MQNQDEISSWNRLCDTYLPKIFFFFLSGQCVFVSDQIWLCYLPLLEKKNIASVKKI